MTTPYQESLRTADEIAQQVAAQRDAAHAEIESRAKHEAWLSLRETQRHLTALETDYNSAVEQLLSIALTPGRTDEQVRHFAIEVATTRRIIDSINQPPK